MPSNQRGNPPIARAADERTDTDARQEGDGRAGYWALLRAVPQVVARVGLRGLTYRAVAREAGVTYGLVSYYFGARDALIEDAGRLAVDEAITRARLVPSSGDVRDFAAGVSKLLAEAPDAQAFQYELVCEARRSAPLRPAVKEMYESYVDAVSAFLDALGMEHDGSLARFIFAALDGIVLQQLVYDDATMTDESIAALKRVLVALGEQTHSV